MTAYHFNYKTVIKKVISGFILPAPELFRMEQIGRVRIST